VIYGLYLSAAGVVTSAYTQDVIANNLANAETSGFKRDLALFTQRRAEAQTRAGGAGRGGSMAGATRSDILENIGGGLFAAPTAMDTSQGDLETTDSPMDVSVVGNGYFAVESGGKQYLSRSGHFTLDRNGALVLANGRDDRVLDKDLKPIVIDPRATVTIDKQGVIAQNNKPVAKLAFLDANPKQLSKYGSTFLACSDDLKSLPAASGMVQDKALERSNVDPAIELNHLMESQRQLEANANMIRYQDTTLGRLVNDVAKIG